LMAGHWDECWDVLSADRRDAQKVEERVVAKDERWEMLKDMWMDEWMDEWMVVRSVGS